MTNNDLFLISCRWGQDTFLNPGNIEVTKWKHRTGIYVGFSDGFGRLFNAKLHRIQSVDSIVNTLNECYNQYLLHTNVQPWRAVPDDDSQMQSVF